MPARRRHQERKRRLNQAVAQAEVEIQREDAHKAFLSLDPLDDAYWRDEGYCCLDCYPNHPDNVLHQARLEIAAFKEYGNGT